MPRGSEERTKARRTEILNACAEIADRMTTEPLSIADIASATSFGRTSIYNYFKTREEIILALLQQQYEEWTEALNAIRDSTEIADLDEFLQALADSLDERRLMLKLINMNLFQVEERCRPEALRDFKGTYALSQEAVRGCLVKYWSGSSAEQRADFVWLFYPFLHGLHPYTTVSAKQARAMEEVGLSYDAPSVSELVLRFLRRYFGLAAG